MTTFAKDIPGDFYALLGVAPTADQETIRQAYLSEIKAWHPDKNPDNLARAEEMTKTLNEAYFTLNDPGRRKQYDRLRRFTQGKQFDDHLNEEIFRQKMAQASPVFKHLKRHVAELYSLFVDAVKNKYPLNAARLGIIGSGLLYFVLPVDFIPDFIPFGGFVDDLSILTMIIGSLQNELAAYRLWKQQD